MNRPQILIIEDDNAIGNLISTTLETQHYQYRRAKNGASGVLEAASCRPDVILLDLGLPDMDGVDIIKKVRTWSNTPIIVISARSEDHDKVEALDAGADDYLTKPFSVEELLARLRVSLRRPQGGKTTVLRVGELELHLDTRQVFRQGQEVRLSSKEFSLLRYMMQNAGVVLSRDKLEQHVWDYDFSGGSNVIDVYIRYLRKKIDEGRETKYIHTVRGHGYVLKEGGA